MLVLLLPNALPEACIVGMQVTEVLSGDRLEVRVGQLSVQLHKREVLPVNQQRQQQQVQRKKQTTQPQASTPSEGALLLSQMQSLSS